MKSETAIFGVLLIVMTFFTTITFAAIQYPVSTDTEGYEYTEFSWLGGGKYNKMYLSIPIADIEGYKSSIVPRMYCPIAADRFITIDTTVIEIADRFNDMTVGKSDEYRINFVNSFVNRCIRYEYDIDNHGYFEYYQYPVETLLSRSGDCEDMAILEIAILRAMGYDAILLVGSEHALTGVNIDADGKYTEVFGKRYYHLEPTIGDPIGVSDNDAIPHLSIYKDIAFVSFAVSMLLCFAAFSGMIWREDGRRLRPTVPMVRDDEIPD